MTPFHTAPQYPISEGSGGSIWSDIGHVAGKVVAAPFRTASTLVNAGIFGAYYVTTLAVTGLVGFGSILALPVRMTADLCLKHQVKPLAEYAVSPARKTFNFISRLYNELPDWGSQAIFAGVGIVAIAAVAIVAIASDCGERGNQRGGNSYYFIEVNTNVNTYDRYNRHHYETDDDDSFIWEMARPYKISTDIGAAIMGKTERLVNGPQVIE